MMQSGRLAALAGLGLVLAGCYTLQPARGVDPEVGSRLAFDINDAGRVALGGAMGPEIAQVEGTLVQKDSAGYLLAVTSLRTLRGGEQIWSGEQVRLRPEYLGNGYEKRFSTGRSIGLGVVSVGGFAAFLATRSLLGLGTGHGDPNPDSTGASRLGRP